MKFNPNRYDLILLFAVVSGIYYVVDETLNNAPPRRHERKTRNSRVAPPLRPPRTSAIRQANAPAKCDCSIKTPRRTKNRCSKKRVAAPNNTTH